MPDFRTIAQAIEDAAKAEPTRGFRFVPNFLRATAVFTREHRPRREYTRHH